MGKYPGLSAASEKNQGLFQGEMERPCGGDGSDFGRPWPDVCCRRPIPEQHRSARRRHSRIHLRSHWMPLAYINSSRRLVCRRLHFLHQSSCCWLMTSLNCRPSFSAALRHNSIRCIKISKYSITEPNWVSTDNSSFTRVLSSLICKVDLVTE